MTESKERMNGGYLDLELELLLHLDLNGLELVAFVLLSVDE